MRKKLPKILDIFFGHFFLRQNNAYFTPKKRLKSRNHNIIRVLENTKILVARKQKLPFWRKNELKRFYVIIYI